MDYRALGKRIRQHRFMAEMTQEDLAEKAGISCSFVGHIERGEKKASLETLIALCNALKVSPALLLQDSLDGEVVKDDDSKLVDNIITVLREHKRWDVEYGQSPNP